MFRFFCSMLLWVTVGRWMYSEAELSAPVLVPVFDSILEIVQIPTHDQWSTDGVDSAISTVRSVMSYGAEYVPSSDISFDHAVLAERTYEVF